MIRREHVKDIRTLAQALAYELNSLSFDILEKASFLSKVELIDILRSAIGTLFEDTTEFYSRRLNQLEDKFYSEEMPA